MLPGLKNRKSAANWVMTEVLADAKDHGDGLRVPPGGLANLIGLVRGGTVSHQAAKRVFAEVAEHGGEPRNVAEAVRASLKLVREESWRREHLHALVTQFRAGAQKLGFTLTASPTPIQPLILGDAAAALAHAECGADAHAVAARAAVPIPATTSAGQVDTASAAVAACSAAL